MTATTAHHSASTRSEVFWGQGAGVVQRQLASMDDETDRIPPPPFRPAPRAAWLESCAQ